MRNDLKILFCFICLIGCSDFTNPLLNLSADEDEIESIQFTLIPNLPKDSNGLYHIYLGEHWQTLHRLNGIVHRGADTSNGVNIVKVGWYSSLSWDMDGYSIPTINGASYSREDGSVSQMMAVTPLNRDDTMMVQTAWYDDWKSEEGYGEPFFIVIH